MININMRLEFKQILNVHMIDFYRIIKTQSNKKKYIFKRIQNIRT